MLSCLDAGVAQSFSCIHDGKVTTISAKKDIKYIKLSRVQIMVRKRHFLIQVPNANGAFTNDVTQVGGGGLVIL